MAIKAVADEAADIIPLMMSSSPAGDEAISLVHSGVFHLLVEEVLAVALAVLAAAVHSVAADEVADIPILMMLLFPAGDEVVFLGHFGASHLLVGEVLAVVSAVLEAEAHSAAAEPVADGKSYIEIKNEIIF